MMEFVELKDLCDYKKEKIEVNKLDKTTYISTENMLPGKGGVTEATTLPSSEFTPEYDKDDILLSNIRPYFKKIWFANNKGGCSNDVLVLEAKKNVFPKFLYYVLSDDNFFDYDTKTSKGTKMPRGDKTSIMKYQVPLFDFTTQKKIADILTSLDDKIELNNRINDNLAA